MVSDPVSLSVRKIFLYFNLKYISKSTINLTDDIIIISGYLTPKNFPYEISSVSLPQYFNFCFGKFLGSHPAIIPIDPKIYSFNPEIFIFTLQNILISTQQFLNHKFSLLILKIYKYVQKI